MLAVVSTGEKVLKVHTTCLSQSWSRGSVGLSTPLAKRSMGTRSREPAAVWVARECCSASSAKPPALPESLSVGALSLFFCYLIGMKRTRIRFSNFVFTFKNIFMCRLIFLSDYILHF